MGDASGLILLFISSALVNNFVLVRFLGICPFLGVSNKLDTAFSMGVATTFVMTLSAIAAWMIQNYVLEPFGLPFLQIVAFILVVASLVQFVEMVIKKSSPALYNALGIFLPLITTNCAVLGLALLVAMGGYSFLETFVFAFGAGVGFTLAMVVMAGIREQIQYADVPKCLKGAGITLITAGILSMSLLGFSGLISL